MDSEINDTIRWFQQMFPDPEMLQYAMKISKEQLNSLPNPEFANTESLLKGLRERYHINLINNLLSKEINEYKDITEIITKEDIVDIYYGSCENKEKLQGIGNKIFEDYIFVNPEEFKFYNDPNYSTPKPIDVTKYNFMVPKDKFEAFVEYIKNNDFNKNNVEPKFTKVVPGLKRKLQIDLD